MIPTDAAARLVDPVAEGAASPIDMKSRPSRSSKDGRQIVMPPLRKSHRGIERPPFECVALVLQGGGALGAFQAGVYQALAEADLQPDWVAGISIGAINAALIAGNAPEARLDKLRAFWDQVTTAVPGSPTFSDLRTTGCAATWSRFSSIGSTPEVPLVKGAARLLHAETAAALSAIRRARSRPPAGTTPSRCGARWNSLVDFDRINARRNPVQRRRRQHPQRQFRLLRFDHAHDQARARHRQRRPAARLSAGRDRGRALLGRRARLQYSAAMGGVGRHPPGHARIPSRPLERARRGAERPRRASW